MKYAQLHLRHLFWLVLLAALPLFSACDGVPPEPKPGAPPLAFHYRKAQIPGKGLVAGIENTSPGETLSDFVIKISSKEDQRSYRIGKTLRPEDSMTVGWVELDGWKLKEDDQLSISCEQYADAATSTVTTP